MKWAFFFLMAFLLQRSWPLSRALHTAATGMAVQETIVSVISNNIANVSTNGYKKQRVETESLLYETLVHQEGSSKEKSLFGLQIGSGSKVSAVRREFTLGSPQITNNPFDLMIEGSGFFEIWPSPQEVAYTRDGAFRVNAEGLLVTKNGSPVAPGVNFPPDTLTVNISPDGRVEAFVKGQIEPTEVGQISVVTFINPAGLSSLGRNMFRATRESGSALTNVAGENSSGKILQGTLESSNVNVMVEMTNLIKAQRGYELNAKVMKGADAMLGTINSIR